LANALGLFMDLMAGVAVVVSHIVKDLSIVVVEVRGRRASNNASGVLSTLTDIAVVCGTSVVHLDVQIVSSYCPFRQDCCVLVLRNSVVCGISRHCV
jgi:hypothetical protein